MLMMDFQHEMNLSKEDCYLSCGGYDGFSNNEPVSVITNPQLIYQVQDTVELPNTDDHIPIILDMSNNVKIESLTTVNNSDSSNVLLHFYTCVNCNLRFVQQSHLDSHYSYCMKKVDYHLTNSTDENGKVDNNLTLLGSTTNFEEVKESSNVCNVCLKSFKSSDLLKNHLSRMVNEEVIKCDLCHKMLHGPAGYLRHLKSHYGKSCEVCNECGKKFTTVKALNKHQQSHNRSEINEKSLKRKVDKENSCSICEKTFLTKEKLEKHLKARDGDVPIKCNLCDRTLHSSGYEYHMKAHSNLKYQCLPCNLKFISLNQLKEHKKDYHTSEKQFFCNICKKSYKDSTGLKMHLRLHTGETPYSCEICNKKFPFSSTLKYHKKIHSQHRPTFCDICNVSFLSIRDLTTHNRIHQGEKIYKCSCGKLFRLLTSLVIHQKNSDKKCVESMQVFDKKSLNANLAVNTGNAISKRYSCSKCNRAFHTMKALEKHNRRRIHTVKKEEPICNVCGKCFQTLGQLKKHEKVHTVEKKTFTCDVCKKDFQDIDELKEHSTSHNVNNCKKTTRIEEFICNVCGKTFASYVNLKKHNRSHTKQRPYTCNICSASFADRSTLNDHHIVHTDARNHTCNTCGKAFKSSRVLKIHSRVHQPDRPYKCALCTSSFKHLGTLISHKVTHTGLKAHQCQVCWMKFAYVKGLKRHHKMHPECSKNPQASLDTDKQDSYSEYNMNIQLQQPVLSQQYHNM